MSNADPIRVRIVVADDHPSIRENLRYLLDGEPDLVVVGVAKDGAEAVRMTHELRPDVLVLDAGMPVLSGIDALMRLHGERSDTRVVMYTSEPDVCPAAMRAGAVACVDKEQTGAMLLTAIRFAARSAGSIRAPAVVDSSQDVAELRAALRADAISIALQPLVEMRGGRLARFEALCRTRHAAIGHIATARLIDMAEAAGVITPLTLQVVRESAAVARDLRDVCGHARFNINLSLTTLLDPSFYGPLVAILRDAKCEPSSLCVEITESMLMREPAAAAEALGRLRTLGVRVEVDDFGTGYSSLGRLIDLPIDAVKIDRRFVRAIRRDHKSAAIVRAIVVLAHDLALEVVAEGVEDRETWELLIAMGCDTAQGYFIGAPMPVAEVRPWLASWESRRAGLVRTRPPADTAGRSSDGVLVVDDEPAIAMMIRDVLEHEGFHVVTAANGVEALRAVEQVRPAMVLLDMQMPLLDGPGFARALRERGVRIPLVVMTSGSSAARWAQELSADAFLSKPFEIDGLVAIVSKYTGRAA